MVKDIVQESKKYAFRISKLANLTPEFKILVYLNLPVSFAYLLTMKPVLPTQSAQGCVPLPGK
jgi:hypothetical protein